MRDHAEPERYHNWILHKTKQETQKEMLDFEVGLLLKLEHGKLAEKYPELKTLVNEILTVEKLTNEYP